MEKTLTKRLRESKKLRIYLGVDGLDDLKKIIAQSPLYLKSDGWLLLEHGFDQGPAVVHLMIEAGFQEVVTHKDYNQIDRVTLGQWA